jgi:predicted permease
MSGLRHTIRLLLKDRSFTITALLTLALCIGANTAIFSVVRSVLLRPLPVPDAGRLVLVYNSYPNAGAERAGAAVPDYFDRLRDVKALDQQAMFRRTGVTLGAEAGAERLTAVTATPSFYRMLQIAPVAGTLFVDQDAEEGATRRVLLGYAIWQQRFGGDAAIVGREIRLNGNVHQVAGVLPQHFTFLWNDIDVYLPTQFTAVEKSDARRHSNSWTFVGRLAPDASLQQVSQQLDALQAANDTRFPNFKQILKDAGYRTVAVNLQDDTVRELRPVLYLLWGGVLVVLLIGCVNIANLVMVRSSARNRELATRHAIGATMARLGRQLLSETMLLAVVGGAFGVALGWWALSAVPLLGLDEIPRGHEIRLDLVSVAVALGLTLVVGLLIGLVPVLRLTRMNINATLREEGRGGTVSRATNLLRRSLAASQIALACILLVGAGLLVASFQKVLRIDPGFNPDGVITASVSLPVARYADDPAVVSVMARILEAARSIPGVDHAGLTSTVPMSGDYSSSVIFAEGYVMKPGESLISPSQAVVSDGYFEAMKTTLVKGRLFTGGDTAESTRVAIIDERLAAKFWPGQDPIGRRLYQPESVEDVLAITPNTKFYNVVGVVKEVQVLGLATGVEPVGAYYFPYSQEPDRGPFIALRTSVAPESVISTLRTKIAAIDAELPLYGIHTMVERMDDSLVGRRVPMLLALAFAGVALFLSAIGVYGVLAYQVAQRRREIGIRMALGSTAREVFVLVLKDGLRIASAGLAVGLVGTYFVSQTMKSQLYDIAPMDPRVVGAVAAVLVGVSLIATLIPARRASRVNPMTALTD